MRKALLVLSLALMSFTSFAETSCDGSALEVAQSALDQKAKAYGFEGGDLIEDTLKVVKEENESLTYTVDGYIYKASYTVTVTVDSSCGLESLKITEDL